MNPNLTEKLLSLIAMGQLALCNASVVIQATASGRTGFYGELQSWLDTADGHLRELRQTLAAQKEKEPTA